MFRTLTSLARITSSVASSSSRQLFKNVQPFALPRAYSTAHNPGLALAPHGKNETDEEFDDRYEAYFNDPAIDGWMIRKRMNDLQGMDLIPEPKIIIAALKACRRVNDYALTLRYLEAVKYKCGNKVEEIWPYLLQELRPTLTELGISTPEELGYDKPELALENPYED